MTLDRLIYRQGLLATLLLPAFFLSLLPFYGWSAATGSGLIAPIPAGLTARHVSCRMAPNSCVRRPLPLKLRKIFIAAGTLLTTRALVLAGRVRDNTPAATTPAPAPPTPPPRILPRMHSPNT